MIDTCAHALSLVTSLPIQRAVVPFSDPDFGDIPHFRLLSGNTLDGTFAVDERSGQLSAIVDQLDFEVQSRFQLSVLVSDRFGAAVVSTVSIEIIDMNELPYVPDKQCFVTEDALSGATVCRVSTTDPDTAASANGIVNLRLVATEPSDASTAFALDSASGLLTVANATILNFETLKQVTLTVCAADRGTPSLRGCGTVVVSITDSNDAPSLVSPHECNVDELAYDLSASRLAVSVNRTVCVLQVDDEDAHSGNRQWATHTWSYSVVSPTNSDITCPFSVSDQGRVLVSSPASLDYELLHACVLSVRATDGGGLASPWQTVEIFIRDINERPSMRPALFSIDESAAAGAKAIGAINAFDPDTLSDGSRDVVQVRLVSAPDVFDIVDNDVTLVRPVLDFETQSEYALLVVATDTGGRRSAETTIRVLVNNVNEPPVISPMEVAILENQPHLTRILPSVGAVDPDGDTVIYSLVEERSGSGLTPHAATTFGIDAITGVLFQSVETLDFETTLQYSVLVKAQDSAGLFATALVSITVIDVNEPPTIASQSVSVREDAAIGTSLGASFIDMTQDVDALDRSQLQFAITGGNDDRMFAINASSGQVSLSKRLDFETTTRYTLGITVRDHGGLESTAQLMLLVSNVNEAPVAFGFNASVAEDTVSGSALGAHVVASDSDTNDTLTYSIARTIVGQVDCFVMNKATGALSLAIDCVLDFETEALCFFSLAIDVSDGALVTTVIGFITVTDVNEAPQFEADKLHAILDENVAAGTIVTAFRATDPDANDQLTYWDCGQSQERTFLIETVGGSNSARVIVLNASALNYERTPTFWIDVCVSDKANATARTKMVVSLNDVYEAPFFTRDAVHVDVKEDVEVGDTIGSALNSVVVNEQDANSYTDECDLEFGIVSTTCDSELVFSVDACGQLVLESGSFDFERQSECAVHVALSTALVTVHLHLVNVNEPPAFLQRTYVISASESAAVGTLIGFLTASDPDANTALAFRIDASAATADAQLPFALGEDGAITLTQGLNFESQQSHEFRALVQDQWELSASATVIVNVVDSDEAPVFQQPQYAFTIDENAPVQSQVGVVAAIDTDTYQNSTITYSIVSGNDVGVFSIVSVNGTGHLGVDSAAALDYERRSAYDLVVRARDSGSGALSAFANVHIDVADVNEAPTVTAGLVLFVAENAAAGTPLSLSVGLADAVNGTAFAHDPDALDTLQYAIEGTTSVFRIDKDVGTIFTTAPLDFEAHATYAVRVRVTDAGGLTAIGSLTVVVLDRNDAPRVTATTVTMRENAEREGRITTVAIEDQDEAQTHSVTISRTEIVTRNNETTTRTLNDVVALDATTRELTVLDTSVFDFESVREVRVTLVVTDSGSPAIEGSGVVTIVVEDVNEACSFAASVLHLELLENAVGVIGDVSAMDPDVDSRVAKWGALSYALLASPSSDMFAISASGELSALKPLDFESVKSVSLKVEASDGASLTCHTQVVVTVQDVNEPPVVLSDVLWIQESAAIGSGVARCASCESAVGASIAFWDPENDTVALTQNATTVFSVAAATGLIQLASLLNFETTPYYDVVVTATDSDGHASTALIRINVVDVNEPPAFASRANFTIQENSPRGALVGVAPLASDPDVYDTISYAIVEAKDERGVAVDLFTIHSCDGEIRLSSDRGLDFEANAKYSIRVRASDRFGLSATSEPITIDVIDVNEPPTCQSMTYTLRENAPVGTVVSALSWSDPDTTSSNTITTFEVLQRPDDTMDGAFEVIKTNNSYALVVRDTTTLDYETRRTLIVTLRIADRFVSASKSSSSAISSLTSECQVTVQLLDVNEPPVIANVTRRVVDENAALHASVGLPLAATDPDAFDVLRYEIQASQATNAALPFELNEATGQLTVIGSLDVETTPQYSIAVVVTDSAMNTAATVVEIDVADVNEPPMFQRNCFVDSSGVVRDRYDANEHLCVYVTENVAVGTTLVHIEALDDDKQQRLYYAITSDPASAVRVVQTDDRSCDLVVARDAFDFETQRVVDVFMSVTDTGARALSDSVRVVLIVQDVNEPPRLVEASTMYLRVPENAAPGLLVGQLRAIDPEGDAFSFVLGSVSFASDALVLTSNGSIYTGEEPCDYESLVQLQASSEFSSMAPELRLRGVLLAFENVSVEFEIGVRVVDVPEPPAFAFPTYAMAVHELAGAQTMLGVVHATDPDASSTVTYSNNDDKSSAASLFIVDATSGALSLLRKGQLDAEAHPTISITLVATDSTGLNATAVVQINVVNDNNPPTCPVLHCWVVENSPAIQVGSPGTQGACRIAVSDPDPDQAHVFVRIDASLDDLFAIEYGTGVVTFRAGSAYANFEAASQHRIRYQASDVPASGYALSCSNEVVISVVDANEPPRFETTELSVTENALVGTTVGFVIAVDEDAGDVLLFALVSSDSPFEIDARSGLVRVTNGTRVNYEQQRTLPLTLSVTDRAGLQTVGTISVTVLDANDAPVIAAATLYATEHADSDRTLPADALQRLGAHHCVDEDVGDRVRYRLGNYDDVFVIESESGQLYARTSMLNFETQRVYALDVWCSDGKVSSSATAKVVVVNVNEAPVVRSQSYRVAENALHGTIVGVVQATDPEHDDVNYLTIAHSSSDREDVSVKKLEKATPCFSGADDFAWISVPSALSDAFVVVGSASTPVSNVTLTVASPGRLFVLLDHDAMASVPQWITASGFSILEGDSTVVTLSSSSKLEFVVYVKAVAAGTFVVPPSASSAFYVLGAAPLPLQYYVHGRASQWFEIDQTGRLFVAPGAAQLDFESSHNRGQLLTFEVAVSDSFGLTTEASMSVFVDDVNEAPTLLSRAFAVPENPSSGQLIGTLAAFDPDNGDSLTFALAFESSTVLVSASGNVTVLNASAFDYETKAFLLVKVRATDSFGLYDEQDVQIDVLDVNEAPVFSRARYVLTIAENAPAGTILETPIHATDQDREQTSNLRFDLVQKDAGGFPFRLEGCSGQLVVQWPILDYESVSDYTFEVRATDSGYPTALTATAVVEVRVTNVNEAPVFGAMPTFRIDENTLGVVGKIAVADPDANTALVFQTNASDVVNVSPSGDLRVIAPADFETTPTIFVNVVVRDNGTSCDGAAVQACAPLAASTVVQILITNVNEAPVLTAVGDFAVQENLGAGALVGKPLLVIDVDGTVGINSGFSVRNQDAEEQVAFAIRDNGQLITLAAMDFERQTTYALTVAYSDGEFEAAVNVTVTVIDVNEAPVLSTRQTAAVAENAPAGTKVLTVRFSDPDTSSSNVFEILSEYVPFAIAQSSGVVTTTRPLDFETDPVSFALTVRVCDAFVPTLCGHDIVTISVLDAPEAPVMAPVTCTIVENTGSVMSHDRVSACAFAAVDPDASSCSRYELVDDSLFSLVQTVVRDGVVLQHAVNKTVCTNAGVSLVWHGDSNLALAITDFEHAAQYELEIRVLDPTFEATGLATKSVVTVNVIDANDCPILASLAFTVRERSPVGTLIGYPLPGRDQDFGDVLTYAIVEANSPADLLEIDRQTGQLSVARDPSATELMFPVTYTLRVSVTDRAGCTNTAVIQVSTANANFAPEWSASLPRAFAVDENVAPGTQIGAPLAQFVRDPDGDAIEFTLQSKADMLCADTFSLGLTDGQLALRSGHALDFESRSAFVCTVVACDTSNACSVKDVRVELRDVNEAPRFSEREALFQVAENLPARSLVPRCLSAIDSDRGDGEQLQYMLECDRAADCDAFRVLVETDCNRTSCARIEMPTPLDYEVQSVYTLRLVATDPQGLRDTASVMIQVADVNELQAFVDVRTRTNLSESVSVGTVLFTLKTLDPDARTPVFSTMRYELIDVYPADMGWIRVDEATGDVIVADAIDFETLQSFTLTLGARDSSAAPLSITTMCHVTVLDEQDTTVDNIALPSGARTLATSGGEIVTITGTNLGFKQRSESSVTIKQLDVRYGAYGSGLPFAMSNCSLVSGNTAVQCTTGPGIGTDLYVSVTLVMFVTSLGNKTFSATSSTALVSYTAPEITTVDCPAPFPTPGSTSVNVVVRGHNFGFPDMAAVATSPVVAYGSDFVAASCSLAIEDAGAYSLLCKTIVGTGRNMAFTVTAGGQKSNVFATECRYAPPVVSSMSGPASLSSVGGESVLLNGSGFGVRGVMAVAAWYKNERHAFEATECKVVTDHVQLACVTVPGSGKQLQWQVEVDGQRSALSADATVAYNKPRISLVKSFVDMATTGGAVFFVEGSDFGPDSALFDDPIVEYTVDNKRVYRSTNCKRKYTNPSVHNLLECVAVAGTGTLHRWRVYIEGQYSDWSVQNTSYAGPVVLKVFRPSGETLLQTEGSQQVAITGKNFGERGVATISSVTYGITGFEFVAMSCEIVVSHERIHCTTVPGVGSRLMWVVTIDGLASAMPTISYAKPFLSSIEGPGAANGNVAGSELVVLRGGNFGPSSVPIERISYGPSGREFVVTTVLSHNDSVISCLTAPGVGENLTWKVVVGEQESARTAAVQSSYAPPMIATYAPVLARTNGTTQVTILGSNFGANVTLAASRVVYTPPQSYLSPFTLPILTFGQVASATNATEFITVRIPEGYGAGATLQIIVGTVSVQRSQTIAIGFEPPVIDLVFTDEGPSACLPSCVRLTIAGSNFFTNGQVIVSKVPISAANRASVAGDSVAFASWHHDTVIVPEFVGRIGYVTLVIGESVWSNSAPFSWEDPVVLDWNTLSATCRVLDCSTSHQLDGDPSLFRTVKTDVAGIYRQESATAGGARLSLYAKFIGRSPSVKIGEMACTNVQISTPAFSPSVLLLTGVTDVAQIRLLTCVMPSGQGKQLPLVVVRSNSISSPRSISYIPPEVNWATAGATSAPTGGKTLTITGTNLGASPLVVFGGSRALDIQEHSHSHVRFVIPPGEGAIIELALYAGNQVTKTAFSYERPVIYTIAVSDASTSGGGVMMLTGANFGSSALSSMHAVALGDAFACAVTSVTHDLLKCTLDEGQGKGLNVVVSVSGQRSLNANASFSYDAPVIRTISQTDGPTSGYTCGCYLDAEKPCATRTHPFECVYLEAAASTSTTALSSFCITATVGGQLRKVTATQVQDVFSNGKPVFAASDVSLQLIRQSGLWTLVLEDKVVYRAEMTTENPPPTNWFDVTATPPAVAPSVTVYPGACSAAVTRACPANTDRCERVVITLVGNNFGTKAGDWRLQLVGSSLTFPLAPVNVTASNVVYFSHTTIKFYLPPGQGYDRRLNLVVSSQTVVNQSIAFGYRKPELLEFRPLTTNLSTCGGYAIALYGNNFGRQNTKVLIGGREARVDSRSSHSRACPASECQFNTSGPCLDAASGVCYPSAYALEPSFAFKDACDGALSHTLCSKATATVDAESFDAHDDYSITTVVPPGFGADLPVLVVVENYASNALLYSYNQPVVTAQMPNQPDANGGSAITIRGSDFGCFPNQGITIGFQTDSSATRRLFDGAMSLDEVSMVATDTPSGSTANASNASSVVWQSVSVLVWTPPKTKAGATTIVLSVGGNVMSPSSQTELKFQCSNGFYKTTTQFCDECPVGATCKGGETQPEAKAGYWREDDVVLACDPSYACLGANVCEVGYSGIRCNECSDAYHKLNSECRECPDEKWLTIGVIFVVVVIGAVISYLLTRKGVSLGLLSIGVDYFQTLSIFGSARIAWPANILSIFSTMSAFNLNLELIAPECFNMQVSYLNKWAMIEAVPLLLTGASLTLFVARYCYKRFVKRRTTRLTSHKPQLFGSTLVMMYYLFLYLTKTSLEVFNCVQSIPPDGHTYMVSIYARCYEPGGIHLKLFPFAVLSFVVYSIGYPVFVFYTLSKNRVLVMEDQLLRAMRRGTNRRTNPNCWEFRKKFSKIYYQFKPTFWYWMVVIIVRKFLLAVVGLLFRQYPTFQLASVMMVLFVNYAFQVRNRPYMSAYEMQTVVDDYTRYVAHETRLAKARGEKFTQPAHLRIVHERQSNMPLAAWSPGGGRREARPGRHRCETTAPAHASPQQRQQQNMAEYLWDHNTVESTLLFSACLVLLNGVMFESGQLGNATDGYNSVSAGFLSAWTMLLIFASGLYFIVVLVTELIVALRPDYFTKINKVQKVFSQHSAHRAKHTKGQHQGPTDVVSDFDDARGDDDDGLEMVAHMTANPLYRKHGAPSARGSIHRTRQRDSIQSPQERAHAQRRRGSEERSLVSDALPGGLNQPLDESESSNSEREQSTAARVHARSSARRLSRYASPARFESDSDSDSRLSSDALALAEFTAQLLETDDIHASWRRGRERE